METDDEDPFAVPLPVSSSLKKRPQPPSRDDPQQQHQPRQPHGFYTPQTSRLVKPLPTAFHSTGGFLSRSGGLPAARRPPPPQTPLKGVLPSNGSSVASTPLSKNNSFFFPGVGPHPGETPSSATSSQWSTPLKKPPRKSHPPPPPLHHAIIHPFQHHATATASTINNNMTTDENENILSSPLQNRRMDMLSSSPQAPVDLHSEFSESLVATPKTRKKPSIENIGHLHSPYSQKHLALGDFDGIQQHPIQALTFQSSARSSPKRSPFLNSNTQNSCENNGHISKVPWSGSPGSAMNTNKRRARDHTRLLDLLTTPFPLFLTAESVRALKDGHYSELLGNTCNQLPNPHPTDATTTASNYFDTAFHVVSQIGEGAFGTVYRVRSWADGLEYAVKKTRAPFTGIKDALKKLEELEIQWSLTHHTPRSRHIVTLKGAWVQYGFLYMQMELCGGGSLQGFLDRECASRALEENKVWLILAQMALVRVTRCVWVFSLTLW